MDLTKEEEAAVVRRLQQLELASKAREADEFLERVEEVHATVKGLIDGTVDTSELEKQQQREVLRKRAKEIRKEEAAAEARQELRMGRSGKGEGKRPYTYFCRFCLVEYEVEDLRCCNRCGRELQTREQRVAELQQRVEMLKEEKQQHASRKARWRRWLQTKKILKSSRLVVDYAAWERWEPSTDEEEKQNEPPVTPADDENFHALEKDLQASARSRAGRRSIARRCKDRGNNLFKKGDWLGALEAYEEGLEHSRDFKELWTNKSLVLLRLQRYEEAREAATRLLEYCEIFEEGYTLSADACFKALSRRALANRALRRFDEALVDLEHAIELYPKDKQAQQLLQQTQLHVKQLHNLEHVRRVLAEKNSKEGEVQLNNECQKNDSGCTQELDGKTQKDDDSLALQQEGQQNHTAVVLQPAEKVCVTADTDKSKTFEQAAIASVAAETSAVSATAAAPDPTSLAGAGRESDPYKAVEALAREKKRKSRTEKAEIEHHMQKAESEAPSQPHSMDSTTPPQAQDQHVLPHVAGSNQTTSAAKPVSLSPSLHATSKEEGGETEQRASGAVNSPLSAPAPEHEAGSVEGRTAIAALTAGSSSSETARDFPGTLPSAQTTAAASSAAASCAAADALCVPSSPGVYGTQLSATTSKDVQAAVPPPSCSTVSSTAFLSSGQRTATSNATTEALKEMQRLLHPAAAAGSFSAIEPPDLSAALSLLRVSLAKLAFCCSPVTHIATGSSHSSSDISSTPGCGSSSETIQRTKGVSSSGHQESSRKRGEKQEENSGGTHAEETAYTNKTCMDTCVADLRAAALKVRRQRRERKAQAEAAAVHTNSLEKRVVAQEESGTEKTDDTLPNSRSLTQPKFDLYPLECFAALQLLHSVCFVEEQSSDSSRDSGTENSFMMAHSSSGGKLTNTNMESNGRNPANKDNDDSSTGSAGAPPWLLEVCEAAAPYVLTLTSELFELFMLYNPSEVLSVTAATAGTSEEIPYNNDCGCRSGYKIVPHADHHTGRGSCGTHRQVTPDCQEAEDRKKKITLSHEPSSHCCAWGACADTLATCMSLLQQFSVTPVTRRKLAEHLQGSSDGRAVLFQIPRLLLCCPYEALSANVEEAAGPSSRWPSSWKQGGTAAGVAEEERSVPSSCALDSSTEESSTQQPAVKKDADDCERRLQQARRDAGALLCNMLLEQPLLHQLLQQQQQQSCSKFSEDQLQQATGTLSQMPQQHPDPALLHLERGGCADDTVVCSLQLVSSLLRRRLQALLKRETLLQEAEAAGASLVEQMESGQGPQQVLPLLWKQAALLSQQQQEGGSSNTRLRKKNASRVDAAGKGHTSSKQSRFSHTEELIDTLLLSTKEVEALEAHASGRASTNNTEEDPLLEEAQQALDIITNMARSSAGRVFVLTHLKEELLLLLTLSSSSSAAERAEVSRTSSTTRRSDDTLSVVDKSQQRTQKHQLKAAELLRDLLTPNKGSRSRERGLLQAVDVLGLLLNLTVSSGVSPVASSSRSFSSVQAQRQQGTSSNPEILTTLQQHFLLRSGGLLPLLVFHVDKLINQQEKRLPSAHAASADEETGKLVVTAGLRSLTIISRLVAAAATTPAILASAVKERTLASDKQDLNKNLVLLPALQQSLSCTSTAAAQHQEQVRAASEQTGDIHRGLVDCLLQRTLKLLRPPNSQYEGGPLHENNLSEQQRLLRQQRQQQQQISAEKAREMWSELHNASLLLLCALANMNVTCLLETAATTPGTFDASNHSVAASSPTQDSSMSGSSSKGIAQWQGQKQEEVEQRGRRQQQLERQQYKDEEHSRGSSALQDIGGVICGWLQVLKPTGYAHERTEMKDPLAIARGNFLLLLGHLAKAQGAAIQQQQLMNQQQQQQQQQHFLGEAWSSQRGTALLESTRESEGHAAAAAASRKVASVAEKNVLKDAGGPAGALMLVERELAELDLRLCIHCCVESLRKDVEGPQKNAAIALAGLARITKYRPSIDALNGFESLMQIAAPKLLGKR